MKEKYRREEITKEVIIEIINSYFETKQTSVRSFQEIYEEYLSNIEGKGSMVAFANKTRISKLILVELGNMPVADINLETVSKFLNSLTSRKYKKGEEESLYSQCYIDKIFMNLRSVIQYMEELGVVGKKFSHKIERPISRKYNEDEEKALSNDEIKMIIDAMGENQMLKTLVMILAFTGVRPAEAYALKITDFDFEKKTVSINRALSVETFTDIKTKKSRVGSPIIKSLKNEIGRRRECAHRILTVSDSVLDEVAKLHKIKNGEYLFTAPKDGKLKRPDYYINEYRRKLKARGIKGKYNFYRFRHTYCTMLFRDLKLDPKTVQYLMGDNSMDMVLRVYHSVNKNDLITASAQFSDIMNEILKRK